MSDDTVAPTGRAVAGTYLRAGSSTFQLFTTAAAAWATGYLMDLRHEP